MIVVVVVAVFQDNVQGACVLVLAAAVVLGQSPLREQELLCRRSDPSSATVKGKLVGGGADTAAGMMIGVVAVVAIVGAAQQGGML